MLSHIGLMLTLDELSSVIDSSSTLETILGNACLIMSRSILLEKKTIRIAL